MGNKTRKMTLSALFAALCVISLFVASVWPTGRFGLVAFASLFVAAAVIEGGIGSGISAFAVSSVIGMLILPNRVAPLLFIVFFGYYPVAKSLIEHIRGTIAQWVIKLALFNTVAVAMWFFMREILLEAMGSRPVFGVELEGFPIALLLGGSIIFVIYDFGFTKLIWFYINRISKLMRKGNSR